MLDFVAAVDRLVKDISSDPSPFTYSFAKLMFRVTSSEVIECFSPSPAAKKTFVFGTRAETAHRVQFGVNMQTARLC